NYYRALFLLPLGSRLGVFLSSLNSACGELFSHFSLTSLCYRLSLCSKTAPPKKVQEAPEVSKVPSAPLHHPLAGAGSWGPCNPH
ncbi:hypothetical protein FB451DRAFT_1227709, partial [Mycena latifolia]